MTTKVRTLTDPETAELQPLLRELHAHVKSCADCQAKPVPATLKAGDDLRELFCPAGAELYGRWLKWLSGT